jgi:hypothetical protein
MTRHGAYEADEPEGSKSRGSQYLTKREAKGLAIAMVVIVGILFWVYTIFRPGAEKAQCMLNVKAISDAVRLYAQENNDRLPPAYVVGSGEAPYLVHGRPLTWVATLQHFMNPRRNFRCPSAHPDEVSYVANAKDATRALPLTYGMYVGASLAAVGQIADPDRTVVIAETSNAGALDTYNPHPLRDAQGRASPVDGFLIGYDTGNFEFGLDTRRVTRLAFPGSRTRQEGEGVGGRHTGRIHVLYVSGRAGTVGPAFAETFPEAVGHGPHRGVRLREPWTTPPAR